MQVKNIVLLQQVGMKDHDLVGGKNASLGEMLQQLSALGIQIPSGFVITVHGFHQFIEANRLEKEITRCVEDINFNDMESLRRSGLHIRTMIRNAKFPKELATEIIDAYYALSDQCGQLNTDVAVRSSATAEDLPEASFAGQQETYLNVRGEAALIDAVRNCYASLFTDRAISYRHHTGFAYASIGLSVCVQKMVRSDLGTSGVAFSLDTESGFKNAVLINGSYGLGELLVQGSILPDEFTVFKPALQEGYSAVIEKKLGIKDRKMVYGDDPDERVKIIPVDEAAQAKFCLEEAAILKLARWVVLIEEYYSKLNGRWCPMDVEWAVDGLTGDLLIVQARPETIYSQRQQDLLKECVLQAHSAPVLLKGVAVGDGVAHGAVRLMYSLDKRLMNGQEFQEGDVLVTEMTDPDWEPIMKKASAIVTDRGGRTCHAAIVAREMGIPAIVGTGNATSTLKDASEVTVSCGEGEVGFVYAGLLPYDIVETNLNELPVVQTPIMLNIASPEMAFRLSNLPNKGVGLAREEFIINNYIGIHPLAALTHGALNDQELSNFIRHKIRGYDGEEDFFVSKLASGVAKIAAAVYPHKCIVRFSDFKSNEYFNLAGGKYFEPQEENPMIGWRGASRYYSSAYKAAFGMECKAIKKAREIMGLTNIVVMIPFCRTVEELLKVQEVMKTYGLQRGQKGLEVYLMAEIPSNVILAQKFAAHIDGFSIGSNDLTQLVLGLDRDSSLVAHIYDERNEAVRALLMQLIKTAKDAGVKVGICGQGPSDYPDFAQFLVEQGIDSISITPDSVVTTMKALRAMEEKPAGM